jgi:hypothetical protein
MKSKGVIMNDGYEKGKKGKGGDKEIMKKIMKISKI